MGVNSQSILLSHYHLQDLNSEDGILKIHVRVILIFRIFRIEYARERIMCLWFMYIVASSVRHADPKCIKYLGCKRSLKNKIIWHDHSDVTQTLN